MMDREKECELIAKFIKRDKRERVLHELVKKRANFINRLCHGVHEILNENLVILAGDGITEEEAYQKIKSLTSKKECYLIGEYDGITLSLKDGLHGCFEWAGGSALFVDKIAFFKEEVDFGSPMKYILQI